MTNDDDLAGKNMRTSACEVVIADGENIRKYL
jgi:hypothetical protein